MLASNIEEQGFHQARHVSPVQCGEELLLTLSLGLVQRHNTRATSSVAILFLSFIPLFYLFVLFLEHIPQCIL